MLRVTDTLSITATGKNAWFIVPKSVCNVFATIIHKRSVFMPVIKCQLLLHVMYLVTGSSAEKGYNASFRGIRKCFRDNYTDKAS